MDRMTEEELVGYRYDGTGRVMALVAEIRASWQEIAELKKEYSFENDVLRKSNEQILSAYNKLKAENARLEKWFNSSKEVYLENADLLVDNANLKAELEACQKREGEW